MKKKTSQAVFSLAVVVAVTTIIQPFTDPTAKAEKLKNEQMAVKDNPLHDKDIIYAVPNQTISSLLEKEIVRLSAPDSRQMKAVTRYIEKAEYSQSGEDVYLAQLLADKLPDKERAIATKRLDKIPVRHLQNTPEKIEEATKEVFLAEKHPKNAKQIRKAQEMVHTLSISKERTELVERLHAIHMKEVAEKEKELKFR